LGALQEALLISQRKPARSFAGCSFGGGLPGERDPLVTVWLTFTEAMYLLNVFWRAQDALWELVLEGTVRLLPVEADDHRRMRDVMKKYRMLPMDLADTAQVAVAERERIRRIFTVDRRDFSLYRPAKLGKFMIVP
jgi:hypothetical protein